LLLLFADLSLRPYQVEGVNWMIDRYYKGHGCILGDEMGLGKTCQVRTLVCLLALNLMNGIQAYEHLN